LNAGRIATIQTLGGSGALKVGADFQRYFPTPRSGSAIRPGKTIAIFAGAGFKVHTYPYFDNATRGVDFSGMLST
jgi:aromatic-amino-acid transaminase